MKTRHSQDGSALILTLLMLALMLTLLLYYVSLVRLEAQVSGFTTSHRLTKEALDQATAEALAALEGVHFDRSLEERVSLSPSNRVALLSQGEGGLSTGILTQTEISQLGWPNPEEIQMFLDEMSWVVKGETNMLHQAYAWGLVPLTGLLDPEGLEGWDTAHLGFADTFPNEKVYLSVEEIRKSFPLAAPAFLPGAFSRDRGWFDFASSTWQTNTPVGSVTVSMNPLEWSDAEVLAVFEERYPDRDFAGIAEAFLDFRDGKTLPTNPEGITAVPVPMFNEVFASMTVSNLGNDILEISHQLDLEIWYPFPGNVNTNSYEVPLTPALEVREGNSAGLALASVPSEEDWTFEVPGGDVESAFAKLTLNVVPYQVALPASATLAVDWNLEGLEIEQVGEGVADRLPAGLRLEMPALTVPASGGVERVQASLEVADPALNHQLDLWVVTTNASLMAVNPTAIAAQTAEDFSDGWVGWTPAGRSGEWEEGWIGFLPLDTPWRSVDLFAEEGQWWLLHTRRPDWVAGEWRRDRVNPNTTFKAPLTAAFMSVPRFKYIGEASPELITLVEAEFLAQELVAKALLDEGADYRGAWTIGLEEPLVGEDGDRHEAESVLRETMARFDVGYHLYGLIVCSELRAPSGQVRNSNYELLLIWMDAFPDENGRFGLMKRLRHPIP